jgi:hypothetical protein
VEQAEIETLVEELENRVERLRALYEQYFMGIERVEPLILRKDVDRRLWVLWREQIRNTGLRFRMHTAIQRYNTYQQYWMRICREIENGTYQRDLRRAAERFGDGALTALGKRRKKMFDKGVAKKNERDVARQKAGAPTDAGAPVSPPAAPAPRESAPRTTPASSRPAPALPGFGRPAAARRAPAPRAAPETFEPLELDMLSDFVGEGGDLRAAPVPSINVPSAGTRPAEIPRSGAQVHKPSPPDDEIEPATLRPPPMRPAAPREKPPAARPGLGAIGAAGPAAPGPADEDLPTTRLRQIYGQYVDAKRRCNESTANLTFDKISKDLRDTALKLRQKHTGKKIDFEIVLKNGTPVLRPVVKG